MRYLIAAAALLTYFPCCCSAEARIVTGRDLLATCTGEALGLTYCFAFIDGVINSSPIIDQVRARSNLPPLVCIEDVPLTQVRSKALEAIVIEGAELEESAAYLIWQQLASEFACWR